MTEYRCPSCDGGFPEPDDDQCPWCAEAMDGSRSSDIGLSTAPLDAGARIDEITTPRDSLREQLEHREGDARPDWARGPTTTGLLSNSLTRRSGGDDRS